MILFPTILQGIVRLRMCEQYWKSVAEPYLDGKFFLWGFVNGQIYRTPVRDLADLEERIYATVNSVTPQMLHSTWVAVEYLLDISRASNGSHVAVYETSMYVK